MQNFRTPEMTEAVQAFCRSIAPESTPVFLDITPTPNAKLHECGNNVNEHQAKYGGKNEYGWIIWQWSNIVFETEAHIIWIDANGFRREITPHVEETNGKILFLPDDDVIDKYGQANNKYPPNRRQPCTQSLLVKEYVELVNEAVCKHWDNGSPGFPVEEAINTVCTQAEVYRFNELEKVFNQKVGRNEHCPCQSGLKYKKCCGMW